MNRLICCAMISTLALAVGCSSSGWYGNNQPAYPIGTYPNSGYPATGYPATGYPPTGYPNAGIPNGTYQAGAQLPPGYNPNLATQPGAAPQLSGQLPTYSTPLPGGFPQNGGYPAYGGYPAGYYPQNQGVPLNSFSPSPPLFGGR
ncbi:MAG: hypothetical protein SGI77_03740 [Pirellulaceae bacterium]|nr:hypothetical protein [Pirellulaceae bacterium]